MTEIAEVRIALADEWTAFMVPLNAQKKKTQAENWREDNPVEFGKLLAYREGGERPTLATQLGIQMVEHVDAWHLSADTPDPLPSTAKLVARASYEGYSDVDEVPLWKTNDEQAKAEDRMTVVTDPLGERDKVMKVVVLPGDSQVTGSGGGERADVMAGANVVPMREGTIFAASLGIMLPNEFQSNSSGWNVCVGAHDQFGGTQSPLQFEIRDGRDLRLRILGGTHPNGLGTWSFRADLGPWPLARNRWYDLTWGMVFSADKTKGRAIVLLDENEVADQACANMYQGSYNYHKQGWYRVAQPYPTTLYMDSTHFWTADNIEDAVLAAAA